MKPKKDTLLLTPKIIYHIFRYASISISDHTFLSLTFLSLTFCLRIATFLVTYLCTYEVLCPKKGRGSKDCRTPSPFVRLGLELMLRIVVVRWALS